MSQAISKHKLAETNSSAIDLDLAHRCVMVLFYADLKARQKNGDSCTWNTTPKNEAFWWGTTANGMAPFCDDEQFVLTTEPPVNDNVKTYEMREHSEAAVFVVLG